MGATLVASTALVMTASVASAEAPTKVQATVTDDFSSGAIQFVVSGIPSVVPADTYGFFCPIATPDGTPHYKLGFVGLVDVVAAM